MFNMTLRAALEIQARQIQHYGPLFPQGESALRDLMASRTDVAGQDLDSVRDIFEINQRVPRGGNIEHACHLDFSGI